MRQYIAEFMVAVLFAVSVTFYAHTLKLNEEIESLNNTVDQVVQMHNEKNHELNDLQYECDILRDANEQLIKHSTPSSINRAIHATPLPKMKG